MIGQSRALTSLGNLHRLRGKFQEVRRGHGPQGDGADTGHSATARPRATATARPRATGRRRAHLRSFHSPVSLPPALVQAIGCYQRDLETVEELGDTSSQAISHANLGSAYQVRGRRRFDTFLRPARPFRL